MYSPVSPSHCLRGPIPYSLLLLLISVGLITGCTLPGNVFRGSTANSRAGIVRARKFAAGADSKDGTLFWSHFDATKRSSIINAKADGTTIVLAEVTPDAAVQKSLDLLSKAKVLDKVDAEAQLKTASTIAQLGQRTANVNMLRDALYRIAEGANNKPEAFYVCGCPNESSGVKADGATSGSTMYERLFKATLTTYATAVKAEAEAEKAKAEAEKAKLEADKAKAKDKPAADSTAAPKPSTSSDSTTATDVSLKLELTAKTKTAPAKKKVKDDKTKIKK